MNSNQAINSIVSSIKSGVNTQLALRMAGHLAADINLALASGRIAEQDGRVVVVEPTRPAQPVKAKAQPKPRAARQLKPEQPAPIIKVGDRVVRKTGKLQKVEGIVERVFVPRGIRPAKTMATVIWKGACRRIGGNNDIRSSLNINSLRVVQEKEPEMPTAPISQHDPFGLDSDNGEGQPIEIAEEIKLRSDRDGKKVWTGTEQNIKRAAKVMAVDSGLSVRVRRHGSNGTWLMVVESAEQQMMEVA